MTNADKIDDGVPMSLEEMRAYLQGHFGIPVALGELVTTTVTCPYCQEQHDHEPQPRHYVAGCATEQLGITIAKGDRYFVPAYSYSVLEYRDCGGGVNELLIST